MFDSPSLRLVWEPRMLSVLRIVVGLLFLEHGLAKIFDFPHLQTHIAYVVTTLVPGLSGLIEAIGGALLVLGLFTRPAAFIMSGEMAAGYFMAHAPKSFFPIVNGGDAAVLYCFIFFYLFVAGPGVWSLDGLLSRPLSAEATARARA